jgi:hypothetical protein
MSNTENSLQETINLIKEKRYTLNYLSDIPEHLQDDSEVIKAIIEHGSLDYDLLPVSAKNNKEVLFCIIEDNGYYFRNFPDWAKDDKDIVQIAVLKHSNTFEYVSERLRKDRDIIMIVLNNNPSYDTIKLIADDDIKNDLEILKLAVKGHSQAFEYIPENWRTHPELIKIVLENKLSSSSFKCLSDEYKDDKYIALKVMNDDAGCFQYLSERLRDDDELAMMAIKSRGIYLQYASDRLRSDKNIILKAIEEGGDIYSVLNAIPDVLKHDLDLAISIAESDSRNIQYLPKELINTKEVIDACMKDSKYFSGECYEYFDSIYKNDREITLRMSKGSSFPLKAAPEVHRNDREIVKNAIESSYTNFSDIGSALLDDIEFIKELYSMNKHVISYMDDSMKSKLFTTIIESEDHNGITIQYHVILNNGSVENSQRSIEKCIVEKDGNTIFQIDRFPVLVYEEDGPVGSYLSVRYSNNIVSAGNFLFFVKVNSGKQTFEKNMRDNGGWGPAPHTTKEFLFHEVYLIPETYTNFHYDDIQSLPRLYYGLEKTLPKGLMIFPNEDSFSQALTVISQEKVYGTQYFEKYEEGKLRAIGTSVHEVYGATFVHLNDYGWRLLIPNQQGALAALEVLKNSTMKDDIAWIQSKGKEITKGHKDLIKSYYGETI